MPAVLRPTEYPSSANAITASPTGESDDDERMIRSSGSFTSLFGISSLSKLSRKSTGDSAKVVDWNWDLANYPKVNGQPTRRHWKVCHYKELMARKRAGPGPARRVLDATSFQKNAAGL